MHQENIFIRRYRRGRRYI